MKIKFLLAGAVAAASLTAGVVSTASAEWSLTGNTTSPNDPWFRPIEFGPADPAGCNRTGISTKTFSTSSNVEQGEFQGMKMTFSGTMTLEPQTSFGNPNYGFNANYGTLTSFTGTFSIGPYGPAGTPQVVTGTFDGLLPPGPFASENVASCYGVGAGLNFGFTSPINNGVLIALNANMSYTAMKDGETITGTVFLKQREKHWDTSGISNGGPDVIFYTPPEPLETIPPTITIPTDGQHFTQGAVVYADFACTDNVAVMTCSGPISLDTSTLGAHTFTVNATDVNGNAASKTATYYVDAPAPPPLHYNNAGFSQPIDMNAVNSAKAGQTIPAKWRLTDANGALVSDPASFVSATSSLVSCATNVPIDAIEEYTSSASGLQYNADGTWQFNWKTPKTYAGTCRVLSVNLTDGSHITATFQFKS